MPGATVDSRLMSAPGLIRWPMSWSTSLRLSYWGVWFWSTGVCTVMSMASAD